MRRALLLAAMLLAGCGDRPRGSAILITLDTTRADALGAYHDGPSVTPVLDRLARESTVFDAAHTVAPLTLPAHTSMLTGLYPIHHTVRDNGYAPVPPSATTVAELARAAGDQTAAFVSAVVLEDTFGLDQGFDVYDCPHHARGGEVHPDNRTGEDTVARAIRWVEGRDRSRPFFLWVHLFDPHSPYEPPPDLRTGDSPEELYRGEVAAMDRALGKLVASLRATGALDQATMVVVADHGESLREHGELTHGALCYEAVLHVPLLVRRPDGAGAGTRSDAIVSVVDVAPTLCEALGARPVDPDGLSLLHPTAIPADRGVYFECYAGYLAYGWSQLAGWLDRKGKYIHSSRPELYDWRADAGELHDRMNTRPEDAAPYREAIERVAARPALEAADAGTLDEGLVGAIRDLGYAGVAPGGGDLPAPLAESHLPAPAARSDALVQVMEARLLIEGGDLQRAEPLLRGVVAENPRNAFALDHLSAALIGQQKYADALPVLQELLATGHARPRNHYDLGACLWIAGKKEAGLAELRKAAELAPDDPLFLEKLAALLRQEGHADEAAGYARHLAELRAADAAAARAGDTPEHP